MKIITSFGSGQISPDDPYYSEVYEIGYVLAVAGYTVCSGGYYGTMQAISQGAKNGGGKTIGITVSEWEQKANPYIDEEIRSANLMERLQLLINKANAFLVFKGGTGTLTEIALTLELMNKDKIAPKPLYFYGDTWKHLTELLKKDSEKLSRIIEDYTFFFNTPAELTGLLSEIKY